MHDHRNDGAESAPRHANTPPPVGRVHGLGYVDFLRIDLAPVQLPWLVDEIDTLCRVVQDAIAHQLVGDEEPPPGGQYRGRTAADAERELDRLTYKLQVLEMVRDQLPAVRLKGAESSGSCSAASAREPDAAEPEAESLALVGPAAVMTTLIQGAARNAADALGEALRRPPGAQEGRQGSGRGAAPVSRLTPAVAGQLRALAAAAEMFARAYVDVELVQGYRFDPDYEPTGLAELD